MGMTSLRLLLLAAIVLSNCITWTTSRHHFQHNANGHRSRHRRQGAGLFLSASYIIPGGEGEGAWGEWGDVSPCSRTCGGGVAKQKRICLEVGPDGQPTCSGGDTKYFSCHTQDCPEGSIDFRTEQCARYDNDTTNESFKGLKYKWIPYTRGPKACELNCIPRGERFYYRHQSKVVDGTRCNDESFDVCVDGVCQPVGCDMMLGSNAREDKCRQCRGEGNNCHTISGLLNSTDFLTGYNDALLIPQGATNIIIEEVRSSNNYLALRAKEDNVYYLNGDYHIDFPRSLTIAGSLWHYERSQQGFAAPDKLRCLGPITESLYLSLLLQEENVGIQYEYSVPSSLAPPPNQNYNWVHGEYSECNATCGGGYQTRDVTCRSREQLDVVEENLCDVNFKPATNQSCNTAACPPTWAIGPWGACSKPCGSGGTKTREVYCEQIVTNGFQSKVADKVCSDLLGPKAVESEECNQNATCPTWFTGPWIPCNKLRGKGEQTRQVVCHKRTNGRVEIYDDKECPEERPPAQQTCMLHPEDEVDWVFSEWSGCDTCLSTVRTRTARCATVNHEVVDTEFCSYHPAPTLEQPCELDKLPRCEVMWYSSQWSKCSVECGKGIQVRDVFCGLFDGVAVTKVNDTDCEGESKLINKKECEVPFEKCPIRWYASAWSNCSKTCGGGDQNRTVMCLNGGKENVECPKDSILFTSRSCNEGPCDIDETLPVDKKTTPIMDEYDYEDCVDEDEDYPGENAEGLTLFDKELFITTPTIPSIDDYGTTEIEYSDSTDQDYTESDTTDSTESDETSSTDSTVSSGTDAYFTDASSIVDEASSTPVSTESSTKVSSEIDLTSTEAETTEEIESTHTIVSSGTDITDITESSPETTGLSTTESIESKTTESIDTPETDKTETLVSSTDITVSESTVTGESASTGTEETNTSSVTEESTTSESETTESTESGFNGTDSTVSPSTIEPSSSEAENTKTTSVEKETYSTSTETVTSEASTISDSTDITKTTEKSSLETAELSTTESIESKTTESIETPETDETETLVTSTDITSSESTVTGESASTGTEETNTTSVTTESTTTESETTESTESSSSSTETTFSSTTDTTVTSSTDTTVTSSTDTTVSSSTDTTESISTDSTGTSSSDTTVSSGTDTTVSASTIESSSSELEDTNTTSVTKESNTTLTTESSTDTELSTTESIEPTAENTTSTEYGSSEPMEANATTVTTTESATTLSTEIELTKSTLSYTTESNETEITVTESTELTSTASSTESESTDESDTTETEDTNTTSVTTESTTILSTETDLTTTQITTAELNDTEVTESSMTTETMVSSSTDTTVSSSTDTTLSISTVSNITDSSSTDTTVSSSTDSTVSSSTDITESSSTDTTESSSTVTSVTESSTSESSSIAKETSSTETTPWAWTTIKSPRTRICKPRRIAKCSKSKFGCCPDKKTFAAGPFDEGCNYPETCQKSKYGCCPDGVSLAGPNAKDCPIIPCNLTLYGCCKSDNITAAEGNDQEGCPVPPPACKASTYGCCKDEETPAKGPEKEGCPETVTETETPIPTEPAAPVTAAVTESAGCEATEFGCCYDNETDASGPNGEGCPCSITEFGCCADGITTAKGSDLEGCGAVISCNTSAYGCCPDGDTPAHGPEYEGCCLQYEFGCCPDNYKRAEGPNQEGCGCELSHFGCCPDNVTIARGPNKEGCGCQTTAYGCCPDRHTEAKGPAFEGCGCHTYQFGCCADGVTIASGPNLQGCLCQYSKYGCCGDEVTAAKGPDKEGCDCSNSKFGCCLDGKTEAKGIKFLNCSEVPETKQAACALPNDKGPCRNFSVSWFYDMSYGGCSRFWYGGCEGNGNRFVSQEECNDVCVQPAPKDVCNLPKVKGVCDGYNVRWYYDSDREQCAQFVYGGCVGNANNFDSQELCQQRCQPAKTKDKCNLPIEEGPCAGNYARWGYNPQTRGCDQFLWGGCAGNANRFLSEAACMQNCNPPGSSLPACTLPQEAGNCTEKQPTWSFSPKENRCMPFYYTGCGGNENRFNSEQECSQACPSAYEQHICSLPAVTGECDKYTQRWFFDTSHQRCRQFYYGGCGGNENNFMSESECENRCSQQALTTTVAPQTELDSQRSEFCYLQIDAGPCTQLEQRWAYDPDRGGCTIFQYGGCGGNRNNFPSLEHCQHYCAPVLDFCQLPMITGPCDASFMRWFYDASTGTCSQFTYSGCQGNGNRFNSLEECEQQCKTGSTKAVITTTTIAPEYIPPECQIAPTLEQCSEAGEVWYLDLSRRACVSHPNADSGLACRHTGVFASQEACERSCGAFRDLDVCRYQLDAGPCKESVTKVYFDAVAGRCATFQYGGCHGGPNRFSTIEECEQICTPVNSLDTCSQPPEQGTCQAYVYQWHYDGERDECAQFVYGGCNGNDNRFETREECESRCKKVTTTVGITLATTTAAGLTTLRPSTTVPPIFEPACTTPESLAPCGNNVSVYYYDSTARTCLLGGFGGCRHPNSYRTEEECLRSCGAFVGLDVCGSNLDPGPCLESIPKIYWDALSGRCLTFAFGGCDGGPNRFSTVEECEEVCSATGPEPACLQPVSTGEQGCGVPSRRWYYHDFYGECIAFVYSGCGGTENNFLSYEMCAHRCKRVNSTEPPIGNESDCDRYAAECAALRCEYVERQRTPDGCERCVCVPVTPDCAAARQDCAALSCPYGLDRTTGDDGCERCRCLDHPCSNKECPEGERCVPTGFRDPITQNVQYNAECKIVNKTGTCPTTPASASSETECRRECNDDADCYGVEKCCEQDCSQVCLEPVSMVLSTAPPRHTTRLPELPLAPQPSNETEPEVRAVVGGKATLRCIFHANPPPKITWRRGEVTIDGDVGRYRLLSDGALEIVSLYRNDSGIYLCMADNGLGVSVQEIRLDVGEPPISNEVLPDCDAYVAECAALRCEYGVQRTRTAAGCERCVCVPVDVDCAPLQQECHNLKCTYGLERSTGIDGCERCRCIDHPCANKECSSGERCVATAYRDPITLYARYSTECRIVNKTGSCPPRSLSSPSASPCRRQCNDDADCTGVGKCCEQDCHQLCLEPVSLVIATSAPMHSTYSPDLPRAPQPSEETEQEVRASEGGKATLRCIFHANPPPKITWRRGEVTIDGDVDRYRLLSDGALEIVSLYRNDSGIYLCMADNGLGVSVQEIKLEVEVPVRTHIAAERTRLAAGSDINLPCEVDGYPVPEVHWTKDDVTIPRESSSDRIIVTEARLTILRANTNDSGVYGCHASNGYSTHSSVVQISVEGIYMPPSCKDSPFFANCNLIVKSNFCNHKYYSRFCCKSCVEAGQLHPNEVEMQADAAWRRK